MAETGLRTLRGDLEQKQRAAEERRAEVEQLQEELATVASSEDKLSQRLSGRERKLVAAEEKLAEERERGSRRTQQVPLSPVAWAQYTLHDYGMSRAMYIYLPCVYIHVLESSPSSAK